jgi:hypothetical protein
MYSYLAVLYLGVSLVLLCIISVHYGGSFLAVDELTEETDGSSGCGEVARGGCLFVGNFSLTRSTILAVADRKR